MHDLDRLNKFRSKAYRDDYLQSRVRGFIAYQIQALREKLGLTQNQFAELTGKKQSAISRLENTAYGKVSVQTLLDIATAANVALVVKFVSYPELMQQTSDMGAKALSPPTIDESISDAKRSRHSSNVARLADYFAVRGATVGRPRDVETRRAQSLASSSTDVIPERAMSQKPEPRYSLLNEPPVIDHQAKLAQRMPATLESIQSSQSMQSGASWN